MQSSSSRISTLIKQAKQTFSDILSNNDTNYDQNDHIDSLKRLMNKLTKSDLNFTLFDNIKNTQSLNSIDQKNLEKFLNSNAPVFYMKLYEDNIISVGIFIIKSHHRIPLHDHPHMFGLIKVLDGHGHLNAYNVLFEKNSNEIICTKHVSTSINSQSETAVIYPNKSNIHEIYAINNEHCAFLDILSPPYSNENDCTCYIAIPSSAQSTTDINENERNYILKRIYDDEYYTESLQYTGPTISL
jgi:cysteamine dioxygenase